MDRESLQNSILPLSIVGFLPIMAWGNAWAMMFYGLSMAIVGISVAPKANRKALIKIATLSGLVAMGIAIGATILMK